MQSPRPFKNPNYTKNVNRRAKNLKAMLGQERERERVERERRRAERDQAMDVDSAGDSGTKQNGAKDGVLEEDSPTCM